MEVKIDVSDINLETERLILRPFRETDLQDLYDYASVPGVGEMAGWPYHRSIEESQEILRSFIDGKNVLALVHKGGNKCIGSLGFHSSWAASDLRYGHLRLTELGYVLAKEYWGQGLMPEAVKAVIDYCFTELGLEALTCGHFDDNNRSRRVIEKCGFKFVENCVFNAKQLNQSFSGKRYIILRDA